MKKSVSCILSFLLTCCISITVMAENASTFSIFDRNLLENTHKTAVTLPTEPKSAPIMLPLRVYAQDAGYNVTWFPETKSVMLDKSGFSVVIYTGKSIYSIGSEKFPLESAPVLRNDLLFVPASLFSDALNVKLSINPDGSVTTQPLGK